MDFASRHIGPSPAEQAHMLGAIGYDSLDELTAAIEGDPLRADWPQAARAVELAEAVDRMHSIGFASIATHQAGGSHD